MTKIKNNFDSYEELKQMNIHRLFTLQKIEIKELDYQLFTVNNKNEAYKILQNILLINTVINKRINGK